MGVAGGHSTCRGSGGNLGEEAEEAGWVDLLVVPSGGIGRTARGAVHIVRGSLLGNIVEGAALRGRTAGRPMAANIGQGSSSGHTASVGEEGQEP